MLRLNNRHARRLFLEHHALLQPPTVNGKGEDLLRLIERLGFVQIDSVNTVERAHHMIVFARSQSYRPSRLAPLLERDRVVFENWTHDASVIPSAFYRNWDHRFRREARRLRERWKKWQAQEFEHKFDAVLERIEREGPVMASEVGEEEERSKGGWWEWHPSKTALEYLWRTGKLAVARREGFRKVYDLSERVIPAHFAGEPSDGAAATDWACHAALDRLGFATSGELAAFWDLATPAEAVDWCRKQREAGTIIEIETELADGRVRKVFARPDIDEAAARLPEPTGRLRVLSPFDPAIRDRNRTQRLFGFHYRIEIFVPEPKRKYGYYVFPLLEGDRLIGRIDMKCNRDADTLRVTALWPEPGMAFGKGRQQRLESELARLARFSGVEKVDFGDGWLKENP